jgi:hypothetical protein
MGWDLAEWSGRCASIPTITGSNPSGGSELTLRSDLLLIARGGSMWALVEFACLPCYPGNTLCSQRLEPPGRTGQTLYKSPFIYFLYLSCDETSERSWADMTTRVKTSQHPHPPLAIRQMGINILGIEWIWTQPLWTTRTILLVNC